MFGWLAGWMDVWLDIAILMMCVYFIVSVLKGGNVNAVSKKWVKGAVN